MKYHLNQVTVAIASLFLSLLIPHTAEAYSFGQKEVDQSKLIAIAAPFADGKLYNLIVIEQISATQSCWQERSEQPGVIDPLLLKFDFTGVCGRSTDSNGYSVRQAGQDLALDYRLSIIKRDNRLVLMGYPVRNPSAPPLTIGQTQSRAPGFLKIDLAPGWRFTKRTYNHKTLGHIYFTHDQGANAIASPPALTKSQKSIASRSKALTPQASVPAQLTQQPSAPQYPYPAQRLQPPAGRSPQSGQPSSKPNPSIEQQNRDALTKLITSPIDIPVSDSQSSSPTKPAPNSPSKPSSSGAVTQPSVGDDSELPVLSGDQDLPPLPPASPQPSSPAPGHNYHHSPSSSSQRGTSMTLAASPPLSSVSAPINIPVPAPTKGSAPRSAPTTSTPGLENTQDQNALPSQDDDMLPVPAGDVPLGSFDPDPDIYTANQDSGRADALAALNADEPPPPPLDERARLRYRVVVKALNPKQQTKIKRLVPDAFRSSYQGRSVFQVGAYESQAEADERLELLSQAGMTGIIETR